MASCSTSEGSYKFLVRRAEVDQVGAVRQNLVRREAVFYTPLLELLGLFYFHRLRPPSPLGADVKRESLRAERGRVQHGARDGAGCGDMRAYQLTRNEWIRHHLKRFCRFPNKDKNKYG